MPKTHNKARRISPGINLAWAIRLATTRPWPDECVPFPNTLDRHGYGMMTFNGENRAHRVAYVLAYGPIPDGLLILHGKGGRRCESRACCNPAHLYAGTPQQNMDDRSRDGMARGPKGVRHGSITDPGCVVRGEQHWNARVSADVVREIRRLVEGGQSQACVARQLSIHVVTVNNIIHRRSWAHVE